MKFNFKILLILILFMTLNCLALKSNHGLDGYIEGEINAIKNARLHSNMGNIYFDEKNYVAALSEYKIAYNLTADTPSSSTYLYNIARCYMNLNNYKVAKNAILGAIQKDCLNMTYYDALCECYIQLNEAQKQIDIHIKESENPYNRIIAGLLYLKTGQKYSAKVIFDEFINTYPDMIITQDVKALLKKL